MKTFKKIFCVILSVIMLVSCVLTAFGADDDWYKKITYSNHNSQNFTSEEEVQANIDLMNQNNIVGNTTYTKQINVYFQLYFSYRDTPEYLEAKEKYIKEAANVPDDQILAVKTAAMKEGYDKFFNNTIANNPEIFDELSSYGMTFVQSAQKPYYDGYIVACKSFENGEKITLDFIKSVTSLDYVNKVTINPVEDYGPIDYIEPIDCPHFCHQSNKAIIWKILCFFYKLFGIKKTCECGKAHY